jgi:hypothetical protein
MHELMAPAHQRPALLQPARGGCARTARAATRAAWSRPGPRYCCSLTFLCCRGEERLPGGSDWYGTPGRIGIIAIGSSGAPGARIRSRIKTYEASDRSLASRWTHRVAALHFNGAGLLRSLRICSRTRENYHAVLKASAQWGDCSCRNSTEFMRLGLHSEAHLVARRQR